ncbi:unnamed protein product [Adineta steineri]|uniref:Methanethiol oxidase n=1 Tax=Adineta steineri TaxID=433720 RepID=A0A813RDH8_9BILA|nr:unnamed protein product [Adineta steineri]CAF4007832.1 unnamed protein product [Adineta steineri]
MSSSPCKGPGYASPLDAMANAPNEKIIYVSMLPCQDDQPNYLATIDVDPDSPNYQKVLHRMYFPNVNDEIHHYGWNACSSCHGDCTKKRRYLIFGCLKSSRIYIVDTINETEPTLHKTIEGEEVKKFDLSSPHTIHCLANGEIMLSCLGNAEGELPGGFLLLSEEFDVIGRWNTDDGPTPDQIFYDFWYQPRHNVMVSSEWAAPNVFDKGFDPNDVPLNKYGRQLHFWNWSERKYIKTVDLGPDGYIPLETRFCHDPSVPFGYVCCALGSTIYRFFQDEANEWQAEKIIQVDPVLGEDGNPIPACISDIVLSMNDKFLYFGNWFHGDVRQYDVSDPSNPKLTGQIWLGGLLKHKNCFEDGRTLTGGPQMFQLSLDGKRLYFTNSLYSSWDNQFYPDIKEGGSFLIKIDCDSENGGMKLDQDFFMNFKDEPNGPSRAHEMRYPGGDCTSDIFN